ncbi:hypothetical protein [Cellulomonas endophytica]|uniref:hypothetical protein n=1 Tax=Cellulomonas endophytica TaxID=2494735 RepID=UPI001012013E|nr:hypothetical protein [Cellulomonas endophytica]
MNIQLLVVSDCAHEAGASALLRQALDDAGLPELDFSTGVISTDAQAAEAHFLGSPTFLIDGRDPFADPAATPAVACRLYSTRSGLAGVPDVEPLKQALHAAAGAASSSRSPTSEESQ